MSHLTPAEVRDRCWIQSAPREVSHSTHRRVGCQPASGHTRPHHLPQAARCTRSRFQSEPHRCLVWTLDGSRPSKVQTCPNRRLSGPWAPHPLVKPKACC